MVIMHAEEWEQEFLAKAKKCQDELSYFAGPLVNMGHHDEYPAVE